MLPLLLLPAAMAGDCVVDRLESVVSFGDGTTVRTDTWTLGAEPGATGCRELHIPRPPGLDPTGVEGRIQRPDRRRVRFGAERIVSPAGPAWTEPDLHLRLPDADIGSTIELSISWRGPAAPTTWTPGVLGPVGAVVFTVEGGEARTTGGPLSGGPRWSWSDVPADQPPLVLLPAGVEAAATPVVPPAPVPVWRIGRVDPDIALAVPPAGLPVRLAAPGGRVDTHSLRRAGIALFELAASPAELPPAEAPAAEPPAAQPSAPVVDGPPAPDAAAPPPPPPPPGPGCDRTASLWRCAVPEAPATWGLLEGAPAPGVRRISREEHAVRIVPDAVQEGGPTEPPTGRVEVSGRWTGEGAPPPLLVRAPQGASAPDCALGDAAGRVVGQTCRFPDGPGARTWSWSTPDLAVAGAMPLVGASAGSGHLQVDAAGATVALSLDGVGGAPLETTRPPAVGDGPGVRAIPAGRASWRVAKVGEREVLPDRDVVIQRIALLGIQASLPEPGLPLRFKNRLDPDGMLDEVLSLVRRRVRAAPALDRGPLSPRPLVAVLRAGWGTAWEQALLLTRYLRQLKVDAVPVPVRPRTAGAGDAASPEGHTAAVVRVQRAGRTHWLVPACALCGVDEIPAELHEASALSAVTQALPPASEGAIRVTRTSEGGSRVELEGAAARLLRTALLEHRPAARLAALPALVGAEGARLLGHEGLAEPGAAIRLDFDGPVRGPALPDVALQGSAEVLLPWAGTWQWTPPPPGSDPRPHRDGLLSWSVEDGTATLRIAAPVAARTDAALGFTAARRWLGR